MQPVPRGGARVNSGPAPDPNALRRDRPSDAAGWTTLPAEGRRRADGKPSASPRWPLLPDIALVAEHRVVSGRIDLMLRVLEEKLVLGDDVSSLEDKIERAQKRLEVLAFQVAEQDKREKALWREVWRYPQAIIWERDHQQRAVAMFVRHQVLGELGSLDDAKEARQWSDRLGVNPTAMLRNRWRIATDEVSQRRQTRTSSAPAAPAPVASVRDRARKLAAGGGAA